MTQHVEDVCQPLGTAGVDLALACVSSYVKPLMPWDALPVARTTKVDAVSVGQE